jgi:DNA (cytosine-5)-methyltransferase 1
MRGDPVQDPIYEFRLPRAQLTDQELELPLSAEEKRLNRDAKGAHSIYNKMQFPDRLDRPVRAITATCTRVSRESIIIQSPENRQEFRRLTLRERASIQGFPITYQFYGDSYLQKQHLIGNAIPPLFVYYLGCAIRGVPGLSLEHPKGTPRLPQDLPKVTPSRCGMGSFPRARRFRAVIPSLRFKSGVRFELANHFQTKTVSWRISFFFGTAKHIRRLRFDRRIIEKAVRCLKKWGLKGIVENILECVRKSAANLNASMLQARWNRTLRGPGPYALLDALDQVTLKISERLSKISDSERVAVLKSIKPLARWGSTIAKDPDGSRSINRKLLDNSPLILSGILVGSYFNSSELAKCASPRYLRRSVP